MGDMGEVFNAMKAESKERRESHRLNSPKMLEQAGIQFIEKNWGVHLIVEDPVRDCLIDFWPGTGKWISREGGHRGRGVRKLIKHVKA